MSLNFREKEFLNTSFKPRTETVPLPDLAQWFNGKPELEVRNLTAIEILFIEDLLKILIQKDATANLGLYKRVLQISISTGLSQDAIMKWSEVFPIEFLELHAKLTELTAKGAIQEKQEKTHG